MSSDAPFPVGGIGQLHHVLFHLGRGLHPGIVKAVQLGEVEEVHTVLRDVERGDGPVVPSVEGPRRPITRRNRDGRPMRLGPVVSFIPGEQDISIPVQQRRFHVPRSTGRIAVPGFAAGTGCVELESVERALQRVAHDLAAHRHVRPHVGAGGRQQAQLTSFRLEEGPSPPHPMDGLHLTCSGPFRTRGHGKPTWSGGIAGVCDRAGSGYGQNIGGHDRNLPLGSYPSFDAGHCPK